MNSFRRTRTEFLSCLRVGAFCIAFGFVLTQTGNPQQIEPPRMLLAFRCPAHVIANGQSMTLQADLYGAKEVLGVAGAKRIAYRWEISGGKVIAGQGTPKITIEPIKLPASSISSIDVKVRLDGGPPDFDRERSCTIKIDPKCARPVLFDQYHGISLKDENQRLDCLAKYLTSEGSGSAVFLVAYAGRRSCLWEAEWRAKRAKAYLIDSYKVDASRIIAIDGGFRDKLTIDLFISPRESCGPFPTPSLMSSSTYVNGSCTDKYKETVEEAPSIN